MEKSAKHDRDVELAAAQKPALRYLVESALKSLVSEKMDTEPRSRGEWVERLGRALMSDAAMEHQAVLASLVAQGVPSEDLYQYYIPEASRFLGEQWVSDEASFVDVTVGAARLQALFRNRADGGEAGQLLDRSIPLGQSVLMVIPECEQHSLGAFVAADGLRRHGLWVRMAIALNEGEIATLLASTRFSLVGITAATWKSVENAQKLIEYMRSHVESVPPIVIGGRVVEDRNKIERMTGADFAVKSIGEAVERCGLRTVSDLSPYGGVL